MIRKATLSDLDDIEASYDEHFAHEQAHGAYTIFKKGICPTRQVADAAIATDVLPVLRRWRKYWRSQAACQRTAAVLS